MVAMRMARCRPAIRICSVSLLLSSVAYMVWAVMAPVRIPVSAPSQTVGQAPLEEAPVGREPATGVARWEVLFERRFQERLYDPPPELPPPRVEKPIPPPPIRLIATMAEPGGGGHAIVRDDKGANRVVPVGAVVTAGDVTVRIIAVRHNSIELEHGDRLVVVALQAD